MKTFLGLCVLMNLFAIPAIADCDHWDESYRSKDQVLIYHPNSSKAYFQKEPKVCPAHGPCAWKTAAYLTDGDSAFQVMPAKQGFVCLAYVSKNGKTTVGWIDESSTKAAPKWISEGGIYWSSEIPVHSRSEIGKALQRPFSAPGEGDANNLEGTCYDNPKASRSCTEKETKKMVLKNCREALRARDLFNAPNSDYQSFLYRLADCEILEVLEKIKPAKTSFLNNFKWTTTSLSVLPPTLDLNISGDAEEDAKKNEKKGKSLAETNPTLKVVKVSDFTLRAEDADEVLIFDILAKADFNRDGIEDLVIRKSGSVKEGTDGATSLVVLTRKISDGRLTLVATYP